MTESRAQLLSDIWSEIERLRRLTETPDEKFTRLTNEKRDLLYEIHGTWNYSERAEIYKRLSEVEEELGILMPILESLDAVSA